MQRITAFIAAATMAAGVISAPAMAQDTANSGAQTQSQGAAAQNFTDDQLQQFADASQDIASISQDYTEQLQNASGEEEQQQVRQQANEEMMEAVQDSGMSVEQFNAIGQAIQQDPQLMQRVQGMAQQQ